MIIRDSVRNKDLMRNLIGDKPKENEKQLNRGNRVIARNELVGYFYSAKVSRLHSSRHVDVKFDDTNTMQYKVSFRNVLKLQAGSSAYFSVIIINDSYVFFSSYNS